MIRANDSDGGSLNALCTLRFEVAPLAFHFAQQFFQETFPCFSIVAQGYAYFPFSHSLS